MYIASLFGALIIVMGEARAPNESLRKPESEQRILLRKLQNFQRHDYAAETVTWNEILADVLVKKLNIFGGDETNNRNNAEKSAAVTLFSDILMLYKSIYDVYNSNKQNNKDHSLFTTRNNPKDDVEVLKIESDNCENCNSEISAEADIACPEGFIVNKEGKCQEPVPSKLILAIPNHCPIGYKADRLGFCRIVF